MQRQLYLGNEAVARGLWEAGCRFVSSYPGTPSTEITEYAATYAEIDAEWAPNEKVALEAAHGAAVAGARAFCGQKHVGLNVAADPLFTASYTGVNAGLVVAVADDPGMHSSQNEQDSRHYARASKTMMLEPADSAECLEYTKQAFALSEQFDTPVLIRLSTRVSHSRSLARLSPREEHELKPYAKDPRKYVMMPAMARSRHVLVEQRAAAQREWAETCAFNRAEYYDKSIGVICSGINYQYAKEALGDAASYLKLGCVYPLPEKLLKEFCAQCATVYVAEDLDDYIEQHCKALGLDVHGKDVFPLCGELSQSLVKKSILGAESVPLPPAPSFLPPARPPVLCAGCPHRGLFYALRKLDVFVSGDIGCYTLGSQPPLGMMDTCVCMGASVSGLHGRNKARPGEARKAVAVLGDSTFIHSGVTGLIGIAYNQSNSVVVILDNSITGMTGHQQNPTTGVTLKGDPTAAVDLEALCRAVGIPNVAVVDPYDLAATEAALREALESPGPAVAISRRPCVLLKSVETKPALRVHEETCVGCKQCMRIGCPAISMEQGKAAINPTQCVGCGVCTQMCKLGAIA